MAQRTASVRTSRVQSRQTRNPTRPSVSSQTKNEVGRRLTGYILRFAVNRVVEQRRHRKNEPGHSGDGHGGGSAMGHAVTNALLEELIQEVIEFIVRHNFFLGKKPESGEGNEDPAAGSSQPGGSQREEHPSQGSHSSTEERRRRRHRRRSEAMMHSLDRLSDELEATYDATVRVLREEPRDHEMAKSDDDKKEEDDQTVIQESSKGVDESLCANLENLRRATTRCMARVESVRRSHHGSRRGSRHRRDGRSRHLSRSGSTMTG